MSVGWANTGLANTFTAMSMGNVGSWADNAALDMAYYWERYEAAIVRPKIYVSGQVWRDVTSEATGISHYSQNLPVCLKLAGGTAYNNANDHAHALKCGVIADVQDAPAGKNSGYSFRIVLNSNFPIAGGDSGAPVYFYLGGVNVKAMGSLYERNPNNHSNGWANHIYHVLSYFGVELRLAADGDG